MNLWRPLETALTFGARMTWPAFQAVNRQFPSSTFQPKWAPAPLKKSAERTHPQLGWPRTTDSLCPTCVRETRGSSLRIAHSAVRPTITGCAPSDSERSTPSASV